MARARKTVTAKPKQKTAEKAGPKVMLPKLRSHQPVSEPPESPVSRKRKSSPIKKKSAPLYDREQEKESSGEEEEEEESIHNEPPSPRRRKTTDSRSNTGVPQRHRERNRSSNAEEEEEEDVSGDENDEPQVHRKIKMIVSGTCQICKVTPLLNIKDDPPSLKKYGKAIDAALVRHSDKIDASGTKIFKTKCSFLPCNQDESESTDSDSEFMFIEIFEQRGNQEETRTRCFMAMLFGYGSSKVGVRYYEKTKNVKNLPTVVYNGASKFWKILQPTIEGLYSCNFINTELSPILMKSISAAWILEAARAPASQRRDKLRLSFAHGIRSNSFGTKINTIVAFNPFIQKWERFLNDPDLMREAIKTIWSDINKEILTREKMDLARAAILQISSTSFMLSSTGQFKLRLEDIDMILTILKQITESLERIRS